MQTLQSKDRYPKTSGTQVVGGLSNPNFRIADDLTRPDDWMSSSLCALRDIHQQLLRDYHCVLPDPPAQGPSAPVANAPAAPDGAASPLQLPPKRRLRIY